MKKIIALSTLYLALAGCATSTTTTRIQGVEFKEGMDLTTVIAGAVIAGAVVVVASSRGGGSGQTYTLSELCAAGELDPMSPECQSIGE